MLHTQLCQLHLKGIPIRKTDRSNLGQGIEHHQPTQIFGKVYVYIVIFCCNMWYVTVDIVHVYCGLTWVELYPTNSCCKRLYSLLILLCFIFQIKLIPLHSPFHKVIGMISPTSVSLWIWHHIKVLALRWSL